MKNNYSKQNPSKKYKELLDMYKYMHSNGIKELNLPADKTFNGISINNCATKIRDLTLATNSKSILDYGCGKADFWHKTQYINFENKKYTLQEFFQIDKIVLYDPAYEPFSAIPQEKEDCVICIDVLEHIAKEDMLWVIENLFSFAKKSLFANIACYEAVKTLPNGENAHCTIESIQWWKDTFNKVADNNIKWEISLEFIENNQLKKEYFGN